MRRVAALLVWVLCVALGPGCSINPATGKRQFNPLSEGREISLGDEAAPKFLKDYGGPIPSPAIRKYVSGLGHRLAAVSERPKLPWEFHVVDSQVINAFALPGGKVFISRGLLAKLENEAMLAGVLGHEIGHVTAQHVGQRLGQALVVQGIATGLGVAGQQTDKDLLRVLGVGAQVGGTAYLLKYGRDHEDQADKLGIRYMTKLDYNPVGQLMVMQVLKRASGGSSQWEMLSTHPRPKKRLARVRRLIKKKYPGYKTPNRYILNEAPFKAEVLDRLAELPPPKHRRKK